MLDLPHDEVHVYWLAPPPAVDPCWLALLSAEERARHDRFVFDRDRRLYLASHAALRLLLAHYTGRASGDLAFDVNPHGKPRLRPTAGSPCVGFNLSHTHGMIAVAVAHEEELGVDVENTERTSGWEDISAKVFTPDEQDQVRQCAPERRQQRFYELWTLKEAYVKARGVGFSLALDSFSLHIPQSGPISISGDPCPWRFELFTVDQYRISVAVRAASGKRWTVRLVQFQYEQ